MSDETYLLQRIMGLETELSYLAESSRQQQFRHNTELSRAELAAFDCRFEAGVLQAENTLQARLDILQAENNTLRVQLKAALSAISYLEQCLKFYLKSLLEQESVTAAAAYIRCNQRYWLPARLLEAMSCLSAALLSA